MQLNVPPDVEALVQRRLATGAFANAVDVIRRALETLDAEEDTAADQTSRALAAAARIREIQKRSKPDPEGWTVLDYIHHGRRP